MEHAVSRHYGAGGFNPFINPKMGWAYVIFNAVLDLAAVLSWQTIVQRVLAAKDSKTGMRIFTSTSFFFVCRFMLPRFGAWPRSRPCPRPHSEGPHSFRDADFSEQVPAGRRYGNRHSGNACGG